MAARLWQYCTVHAQHSKHASRYNAHLQFHLQCCCRLLRRVKLAHEQFLYGGTHGAHTVTVISTSAAHAASHTVLNNLRRLLRCTLSTATHIISLVTVLAVARRHHVRTVLGNLEYSGVQYRRHGALGIQCSTVPYLESGLRLAVPAASLNLLLKVVRILSHKRFTSQGAAMSAGCSNNLERAMV